jgi:DNA-binding MarR family transcriptional regulator
MAKTMKDFAEQLATAFEISMYRLTLLGSHLPKTADGLTPQQLKLLSILSFAGGPLTMATAATRVGVAPGTLTDGVKRLVTSGLVLRQRAESDDRVVELSLSPSGARVMDDIRRHRVEFFREACSDLDAGTCRALIESHQTIADTYSRIIQNKMGGAA